MYEAAVELLEDASDKMIETYARVATIEKKLRR